MTNPDSAMAAAREIDKKVLRYETSEIEADPVTWLAAIIRKHQEREIGELVECLRRLTAVLVYVSEVDDNVQYFNGRYCGQLEQPLREAESLLSRYQKV